RGELAGPRAALLALPMLAERLDLVRRLTAATPAWALLKGGASALDGRGDLDCVTPTAQVPLVRATIEEWSRDTGRGPVLACGHLPGTLVLAVVEPGPSTTLVQLDLFDHRLRRGA